MEIYKVLAAAEGASVVQDLNREIERFRRWPGPTKTPARPETSLQARGSESRQKGRAFPCKR